VTNEKANEGVRAVSRALDILMAFTAMDYELTAAQLLKRVDLSKPTLYRLLNTLEQSGFLLSSGDPQRFRLGSSVAQLAHAWLSNVDFAEVARPIMRKVWEETGETVALFVPQGRNRTCIAEMPSTQPLSFKRGLGYSERIVLGASGRAILAGMQVTDQTITEYAKDTNADIAFLLKELKAVHTLGYAVSKSELIEGAVAIAASFQDRNGEVVGSLGVFGPSVRLNGEKIAIIGQLLVKEARALSDAIGGK
jgi:IclR family acetate operon transcriptional repressor